MTSQRGVVGAACVLLAIPMALLLSLLLGRAETLLHLLLGVGFWIVAVSLFDFRTTRWVCWVGGLGLGGLGAIFLLQGASDFDPNGSLHDFAYEVLGQWPERVLPDLFFIWCWATLFQHGRGRTRRFGIFVMTLTVAAEVLDYGMSFAGGDAPGILKLLYLLPFAWLLLESRRPLVR